MSHRPIIHFPPFAFDIDNECLRRSGVRVRLSPKAFRLLERLVSRAGVEISKRELVSALWPDSYVSEGGVKAYVLEIRRALNDSATNPKYIETSRNGGYRFIAPIQTDIESHSIFTSALVGREQETALLMESWQKAVSGEIRVVFLRGERGIGRTALVQDFYQRVTSGHMILASYGHCPEPGISREPYSALLDAIGNLLRGSEGELIRRVLHTYAPQLANHFPPFTSSVASAAGAQHPLNAPPLLREIVDLLDVLAHERSLLLILDDLHRSDLTCLSVLQAIVRLPQETRLLIVGSYCDEQDSAAHALVSDMAVRRYCQDIQLLPLTRSAVAALTAQRLKRDVSEDLLTTLLSQSGGNPTILLALLDMIENDEDDQMRVETLRRTLPEGLRRMIVGRLEQLSLPEQRTLEVACLAGDYFTAEFLARGLEEPPTAVGLICEQFVTRHIFARRSPPVLRDPQVARQPGVEYCFCHGVYRRAAYDRLPPHHRTVLRKKMFSDSAPQQWHDGG